MTNSLNYLLGRKEWKKMTETAEETNKEAYKLLELCSKLKKRIRKGIGASKVMRIKNGKFQKGVKNKSLNRCIKRLGDLKLDEY